MIRNAWLAAVVVVLAPLTCLGQGGGMGMTQIPKGTEEWSVKIETFGGNKTVTGNMHLLSVVVQCDVGTYEIKPGKVKTIQFAGPMGAGEQGMYNNVGLQREGVVITSTDEKIAGVVNLPIWWKVETDLGTLTPDGARLKSITFLSKVEASQQHSKPGGEGKGGMQKPNSNNTEQPGSKPVSNGSNKPNDNTKPDGGKPDPEIKP